MAERTEAGQQEQKRYAVEPDNAGNQMIKVNGPLQYELSKRMNQLGMKGVEVKVGKEGPRGKERFDLIVQAIAKYNHLNHAQILKLFYYNLTRVSAAHTCKRELARLVQGGWLETYEQRDGVYKLGWWAKVLLATKGRNIFGDRTLLREHDLLGAELLVRMLSEAREQGGNGQWWGEYELQLSDEIRPDAVGRIAVGGNRIDFFAEADTGSERESQFGSKYQAYARYRAENNWQRRFNRETFPPVLVISSSKELRLMGMLESLEQRMNRQNVDVQFYLTTRDRIEKVTGLVNGPNPGVLHGKIWSAPFSSDLYALLP